MNRKIHDSAHEVLSVLPERTQSILKRRLGIQGGEPETLEGIGQEYGITRERVRQIEAAGLKSLRESNARQYLRPITSRMYEFLLEHGGVMEERFLLEKFHKTSGLGQKELSQEEGCLRLFLELADEFYSRGPSNDLHPHWYTEEQSLERMKQALKALVKYLQNKGELLKLEHILEVLNQELGEVGERPAVSYLEISRQVEPNIFGEYGLKRWAEIRPRGIKDKSYLVFRHVGEPLHFRQVAEKINEMKLSERPALPQTVHNELIKDKRFVLVGRGIYALRHWGYQPGTVKDVLINLLKENGAMSQEELIQETLAQRQVKSNTILLNLHNRSEFKKLESGKYTLSN